MAKLIADRILWAVETLAVAPSDCILEIGCGHGTAVSLICRSLIDGTIMAIDRSEKMIDAARKTNARYIAEGKATFLAAPLHKVGWHQEQFDKIFALNVNLFWMKAARDLAILKERLLPGGSIYLFNQPPSTGKIGYIAERTVQNLLNAGFNVRPVVIGDQIPVPVVCVIGHTDRSK